MYDTAIVGTGPAGLSAALNLQLHEKSLLWFGSKQMSDQVEKAEQIVNYPGFGSLTGRQLNEKFREQAVQRGFSITEQKVTSVMAAGDHFMLLADQDVYEVRTVLLATGLTREKGFEGEKRLLGNGVSYCATCDGFLYKGKTIVVYCGNPRYESEVDYLAQLAKKVYLSTPYRECGIDLPNVERLEAPIREVQGQQRVEAVLLSNGRTLLTDGLFCLRTSVAPETLAPGLKLEGPHIVVSRAMETNLPGCFAAGDCTGRPYQITKAVGEGNVAAHSILDYLSKVAKNKNGKTDA